MYIYINYQGFERKKNHMNYNYIKWKKNCGQKSGQKKKKFIQFVSFSFLFGRTKIHIRKSKVITNLSSRDTYTYNQQILSKLSSHQDDIVISW